MLVFFIVLYSTINVIIILDYIASGLLFAARSMDIILGFVVTGGAVVCIEVVFVITS